MCARATVCVCIREVRVRKLRTKIVATSNPNTYNIPIPHK